MVFHYISPHIVHVYVQTRVKKRNSFMFWGQNITGIIIKWSHYIKLLDCIIAIEMLSRQIFSVFTLAIFVKSVMIIKSYIFAKRDVFTKQKNQV